jgi:hypothetical protein
MATITRITVRAPSSNRTEVYYEPAAPRAALAELRAAGFAVATRRVDAADEIRRLRERSEAASYQSAALAGASSDTHLCRLMAAKLLAKAQAAEAAVRGEGELSAAYAARPQ